MWTHKQTRVPATLIDSAKFPTVLVSCPTKETHKTAPNIRRGEIDVDLFMFTRAIGFYTQRLPVAVTTERATCQSTVFCKSNPPRKHMPQTQSSAKMTNGWKNVGKWVNCAFF